jgi:hypothetical protein
MRLSSHAFYLKAIVKWDSDRQGSGGLQLIKPSSIVWPDTFWWTRAWNRTLKISITLSKQEATLGVGDRVPITTSPPAESVQ